MNLIEFGDCREIMRKWKVDGIKVQTCITSPPYYGLRDYGHEGQIGLEETPLAYIDAMVEVFRCVKDILSDDGTLWLNIGDSYSSHKDCKSTPQTFAKGNPKENAHVMDLGKSRVRDSKMLKSQGLKNKDLIGIPWMLAFALRADGWYLRQDIIWHKPNPMPESVCDRCTKAHEYIFLLSKSPQYYFDHLAIKEPSVNPESYKGRRKRSSMTELSEIIMDKFGATRSGFKNIEEGKTYPTRNKRDVWTVNVKPYKGAHFATFPQELIEPCVLAGSKEGDVVFDPFMGSGTTAQVALDNNRQYLGCELNPDYKKLQDERLIRLI